MRCFAWQAWSPGPKLQMAPILTTIRVEDGQNWRHSQTAFLRDFLKALLGMISLAKPQVSKIPKARAANRASQAEAGRALGRAKIANGASFDHSFANHGQNRRRLQTPSLQSPFARGPLGETYAVTGTPSPKSSSCSNPVRAARAWSRRLFMPLRNWRYITSVR